MLKRANNHIACSKTKSVFGLIILMQLSGCGGGGSSTGSTDAAINNSAQSGPSTVASASLVFAKNVTPAFEAVEIKSAKSSVTATGRSNAEQKFRAHAGNFDVAMWANSADGLWSMKDNITGYTTTSERKPNFTVIRVYSATSEFVGGVLSYMDNGVKVIRPMNSEGDIDTSDNQTPVAVATRQSAATIASKRSAKASAKTLAAADETCESFVRDLTSVPADFAEEASGGLDDGNDIVEKLGQRRYPAIVARTAQFLSDILRKSSSLCDDSATPVTELEFERNTIFGAFDAILDGDAREVIDGIRTRDEMVDKIKSAIDQIKSKINSFIASKKDVSDDSITTGLTGDTRSAIASSESRRHYLPRTAPSCLGGQVTWLTTYDDATGHVISDRRQYDFINNCSFTMKVWFCETTQGSCVPNKSLLVASGTQVTHIGRELVDDPGRFNSTSFWLCPGVTNGHDTYYDSKLGADGCYYIE